MAVLDDEIDQRPPAQRLCETPGLGLVEPHQRGVQHEAVLHAEVERDLQRLDRVVAAIGIAGIVRLAHPAYYVAQAAPVGERGREGQEDDVAAGHEGVGQARGPEPDCRIPRQRRLGDLSQCVEGQGVVLAEPERPGRVDAQQAVPQDGAAVEFDPVALAVIEAQRLDVIEPVQRPGEAGGRILPPREQHEGLAIVRDLTRHRIPPTTSASRPPAPGRARAGPVSGDARSRPRCARRSGSPGPRSR